MRRLVIVVALTTVLVSCTGVGSSPAPVPGASGVSATAEIASTGPAGTNVAGGTLGPVPAPTPLASVPRLDNADLRYRLVDQLGRPLFCDPDFYPVARADEAQLAQEHLAAIQADAPTYAAIATHLGIDISAVPTPDQALAIYRDWKMLRGVALAGAGGHFTFDYVAAADLSSKSGFHVVGSIDAGGEITVDGRDPAPRPICPICLALGTLIATPGGDRQVQDLWVGMAVWTADGDGLRIAGHVLAVGSTPVPPTHAVVDLVLSDGRTVDVSPGHGLPDGRHVGDLLPGDRVDGATVVSAALEPYAGGATFDLLPSGPTGAYWANGIPLASTLGGP